EIGKKEARVLVEGTVTGSGWYIGPTVFADVASTHRVAQEEIFGPILAVMKAASFEEALTLANATAYALTGGVYSRSPANLELARQRFDVGNLYLNRPITGALVGRQPFGGHRLSGVGAKAGGEEYLMQFVVARVVSEQTLRRGFAPPDSSLWRLDFVRFQFLRDIRDDAPVFQARKFLPLDILDQSHALCKPCSHYIGPDRCSLRAGEMNLHVHAGFHLHDIFERAGRYGD